MNFVQLSKRLLLMTVLVAAACGCKSERVASRLSSATRDAIYLRRDRFYTNVILFKPLPDIGEDSMAFRLAPLILKETLANPSSVEIITNRTPVFVVERSVLIQGRSHRQFTYYWSDDEVAPSSRRYLQGVRITLDAQMFPVVWEILADDSGGRILFVSESVEARAMEHSGKPLPNRRFAIERPPQETPATVVARVISDGMTTMGPIIYQREGSANVETLICRCMSAQATRAVKQIYFRLEPLSPGEEMSFLQTRSKFGVREDAARWLEPRRLERQLRLPENF